MNAQFFFKLKDDNHYDKFKFSIKKIVTYMPERVNDGLFIHLKIAPKSIGTILSMPPIDYCQFPTVYLSI